MEDRKYTVYMHKNKINNKAYVGITCRTPSKRWSNGRGYKTQSYFWNAIKKYGWNNFEHIIFMDGLTKTEACRAEQLLISAFNTTDRNYGYNTQYGGEAGNAGVKASDETREKMSIVQKAKWTDQRRKEKSKQVSGCGNPMFGVHRFGETSPMYGKNHSDETKAKISQTKLSSEKIGKPVICIETGIIYKNTHEAERQTGICYQNILGCCNHLPYRKTAKGYHWEFYVEEVVV